MMALLSWRVWTAVALAVALAASHWKAYHMGQAEISAAWAADSLAQASAVREAADLVQAKLRKANDDLQIEKKRRAADAVRSADSLREFQAAIGGGGPDATAPGGTHGAGGIESELLGNCAQALVGLGQEADRLAGKVVGLQDHIKASYPTLQPAQP